VAPQPAPYPHAQGADAAAASGGRRDKELAKFEAFLNKEECKNIYALVRGRSRMAYPIKT
jgi:hypothetical protein